MDEPEWVVYRDAHEMAVVLHHPASRRAAWFSEFDLMKACIRLSAYERDGAIPLLKVLIASGLKPYRIEGGGIEWQGTELLPEPQKRIAA